MQLRKNIILRYMAFVSAVALFASCASESASPNSDNRPNTGQAGSLAKYAVAGGPELNYLYAVTSSELQVVDIADPTNLRQVNSLQIDDRGIETIFPFKQFLLLGTQSGMLVYDISQPTTPTYVSEFWHVRSCDPVVAQDSFAYVTLRGGTNCGGTQNELHVLDISQPDAPEELHVYQLNGPYGLGIDGDLLFVCDGNAGLRVYDASNPAQGLEQIAIFTDINAKDVIPHNGLLLMIGDDGFYQYRYENQKVELISKIDVQG